MNDAGRYSSWIVPAGLAFIIVAGSLAAYIPAMRGEFIISTPMDEREVDKGIQGLKDTFEFLKPYMEETTAHLIA